MATKERPILFSGSMVRAILEGRKTQTRRIVKPQLPKGLYATRIRYEQHPFSPSAFEGTPAEGRVDGADRMSWVAYDWVDNPVGVEEEAWLTCPYGKPGDLLWVRETWHPSARLGTQYEIEYRADSSSRVVEAGYEGPSPKIDAAIGEDKWRPSIFMPRWASRITLRITDIRVERVQAISEQDAIAEGLEYRADEEAGYEEWGLSDAKGWAWSSYPTVAYAGLWDSINGNKPGCSWADNPWVWVVSFEREEASHAS